MHGPPWLVLPTYNEAPNVERFVGAVLPVLTAAAPGGFRVLVVDDNSPDGTGRLADRLAAEHAQVEVLHRPLKQGLGPAYKDGFRHALEHGAGFVLEMDSDFSHDPADLARLLAAAHDADLVLGSRYVAGGGTSDWGVVRRLVSQGGCWYARQVLRISVRDLTGGFKCFRREVLEAVELDTVEAAGYAFQVELTYRALLRGFRVVEVPIVFRERQEGTSKMTWRIAAEAMWRVPRLRRTARASEPDAGVPSRVQP